MPDKYCNIQEKAALVETTAKWSTQYAPERGNGCSALVIYSQAGVATKDNQACDFSRNARNQDLLNVKSSYF